MEPLILSKLEQLFPKENWAKASQLLESECGENLPLIASQGNRGIVRIRSAVLKISNGSFESLEKAIHLAKNDWRDVLVAAGFENDASAHLSWLRGESNA